MLLIFDIDCWLYKKYSDLHGDSKIRETPSLWYNGFINIVVFFAEDFCLTTGATHSFFDWYSKNIRVAVV